MAFNINSWYVENTFIFKNMRNFLKVSNSKEITIKLSTEQLFFIVTCLLKLIRLDKSNFKYNYRIYKIIDKISFNLFINV